MAVILYGVSTLYLIFLFQRGLREDSRIPYLLLLAAFIFHTLAMVERGFRLNRCPIQNLYEATLFVEWVMLVLYLIIGISARVRFLGAFASPLFLMIGVFALMPQLDQPNPEPTFRQGWLSFHVALFALAYAAFGLSSVAGIMYLTQERDLKLHKLRAVFSRMPPLQRLEVAAGYLLLAGLIMWTAALAISAVLAHKTSTVSYFGDPKIIWSLLVWALYGGLFLMRWKFAQRGRRFAMAAIATFAFVLLTYPLSSLLSPIHHP